MTAGPCTYRRRPSLSIHRLALLRFGAMLRLPNPAHDHPFGDSTSGT
jgi:hypothetical protein